MHENHRQWLEGRGLDPVLAEKLGIETVRDGSGYWLTVPYSEAGEIRNHKYRQTQQKVHKMDQGADLLLWNCDVLSDPEILEGGSVVITEGEWDALTAIQCGFPHVVSVPNGAPTERTAEPDSAKRYSWVHRHKDALDRVERFILAVDSDEPGYALAADLASLLGAERCRFVKYPDGSKDLNDVLLAHGTEGVVKVIASSKPYPIKGLYSMDDFPEKKEVRSYSVGVQPIREMVHIVPGTLTVMTGYANMGKSTLVNSIIGHAIRYHFPVCIASFETDVKPILRDGLRQAIMGCSSADLNSVDTSDADEIISNNLRIITQAVDEDAEMDLDSFLDYCRVAVIRDGVKMVVLDPWNELEHKRRRDENETDYISRALRAIKRFAKQFDVAFWIIAHPTKPGGESRNRPPGLYDISGSANWANKADYGICYHRPKPDVNSANIIVNKVRMGLPGKKGMASVTYDFRVSEFREEAFA